MAVLVACVVFVRVNNIEVTGNHRYTAVEIIEVSGIQMGDNLVTLAKGRVASNIRAKLPYVEGVAIRRVLPDGIVLHVTERVAAASVDSGDGRWLVSAQGKVLERAGDAPVMEVTGLTALAPYAGGQLQVDGQEKTTLDYVLRLLTALEEHGMLEKCTSMDCTGSADILVGYGIYQLRLPRGGDYDYMIRLLEQILASPQMPQDTSGTLDFTVQEGRVHFQQNR